VKIILSPSKTQKIEKIEGFDTKELKYRKETDYLVKILKKLKKEDIKKIMKTSDKLTEEILGYYRNFYENETGHAAASYTGVAYRALAPENFSKEEVKYMEDSLVILSALYGVLTPLTGIKPYRLDMTMSVLDKKSLYEYWKESIDNYFEKEELIINLASKEFSKMIRKTLTDIEFYEMKNGKAVQISTNSKKARGEMARHIIIQKLSTKEKIKKITFGGYKFDKNLSEENRLVFIKQ
jgi:cytoplasmic iron level regulating protein YaaA (DUF328/UPF0246 family)